MKDGLYQGDCLELMKEIETGSVNMILCDLPYGTTQCSWDSVIPFDLLWAQYERIIKDNGAIVLTAAQPFTSHLIISNQNLFKYEWIWQKTHPKGHLNAHKQPMRAHENVLVFYKNHPLYFPQKTYGHKRKVAKSIYNKGGDGSSTYGQENRNTIYDSENRFPLSIQVFSNGDQINKIHPTQKPVSLMEYMIRTYSNENDLILDNCMGSGTTGVACKNLNRRFIGMEQDEGYFKAAMKRINETQELLFVA